MDNKDPFDVFDTETENTGSVPNIDAETDIDELFATFSASDSGEKETPTAHTGLTGSFDAPVPTDNPTGEIVMTDDTDEFDLNAFESEQTADTATSDEYTELDPKKYYVSKGRVYKKVGFVGQLFLYLCNLVLTIGCLCVIVGCVVATLMVMYVVDVTKDDPDFISENNLKLSYTTILYAEDKQNGGFYETQRLYGTNNRIWVDYADIPQYMIDAVIAVEDQHFKTHQGVDWPRTFAAFVNQYIIEILPGLQGGSTITQQLIKNITKDSATDPISGALRKLREIYRALVIENNHSKEEIIEAYLNTIPLTGLTAGVEAGANQYFCTTTKELSLAQSCAIVCITNRPTTYNPLRNPDNNRERVTYFLKTMYDQGMLTYDEWQEARAEALTMPFSNTVDENGEYVIERLNTTQTVYSYYTDMVINDVINDLVEINGMTRSAANNLFWNKGLRIYTAMDTDIQAQCEATGLNDWWSPTVSKYGDTIQGSCIILNTEGRIMGILGGIGPKTVSRGLNRPVDTRRQTGSTMKPIGVYGPAMQADAIHYSTVIINQPIQIVLNGVLQLYPVNFSRTYGNPRTVVYAIAASTNTCAVRCLQKIGFKYSYSFLQSRLGVTSLWGDYDRTFSSLALGGLYNGMSLLELAAAYVPFSNGGKYYEPYSYTKVVSANGEILLDKVKSRIVVQAFSSDTAYIMNKALQAVYQYGTASDVKKCKQTLAGKTGTSNDNKDYQIIAMTPYYTMAVRIGYDKPDSFDTAQKMLGKKIINAIMPTISSWLPAKSFPVDPTVTKMNYCHISGELFNEESGCWSYLVGYYKSGGVPGQVPDICDHAKWIGYTPDKIVINEELGDEIE